MQKDEDFRRIEKMLYEFKTYPLAIKNLLRQIQTKKDDIDTCCMPTCISNYSEDPVSYTVGNTSDSTASHAIRRVNSETLGALKEDLEYLKNRLKEKQELHLSISEVIELFDEDEKIIFDRKYTKNQDVAAIYDSVGWSKTTYFRIRKRMINKVRKCLGEI